MKKGFSSNSSPKTFSFVFSARGTALKENLKPFYLSGVPLYKKPCRKSLERGLGKNLSPERFAPAAGINFCIITGVKQPQINFVLLPTLALSKSGNGSKVSPSSQPAPQAPLHLLLYHICIGKSSVFCTGSAIAPLYESSASSSSISARFASPSENAVAPPQAVPSRSAMS